MAQKGIAIIGAGMIGGAHANAYRQFAHRFGDMPLAIVCDTNAEMAGDLAQKYGFKAVASDWKQVISDSDIHVVSVCLPNFLHTEVTQAALAAGKHVLCEKPLALSADQARPVRDAARTAACVSGTVFNYRRIPALADIRARIEAGDLGAPVQISVLFQCDYAADPMLPHSWRYEFDKAGPGALLDLGTHAVDMARFMFGDVAEVVGAVSTISVPQRHLPLGTTTGHGHVELSDETATVDNDDVMSGLVRFANGAQGFVSASRVAVGSGNRLAVEVHGTRGTARFTTEMPSFYELALFAPGQPSNFMRVPNRPSSPSIGDLAPVPHDLAAIGYAEVFGYLIHEFLGAIAEGKPLENGSIEDGYRAAQVLDAIQRASVVNEPVKVAFED
ncbi:Gfo/Idh/MocA family protein [Paracoccus fistulariae]|uniref:Gfo/Idh/MocA family oxidoreductase n=1 Tax=Paracoccus fistulariae TaxID=658446 RepID=A0ABY7SPE0_9RHOB|nr:Gfo/Idh/MocA family oxidoreductase [Paracoccus fistulariae]MDB6182249.1 Gfo/Idh/MocA family oxidoreductase [Paracoccus fistulariae]WCR08764.1 Gfo/Idh/MocA family oxidoreductase [Paracoccus fistulariae]